VDRLQEITQFKFKQDIELSLNNEYKNNAKFSLEEETESPLWTKFS
jgi:hypothetical protein